MFNIIFNYLRKRILEKRLNKAIKNSDEMMSKMSMEERRALYDKAMDLIYPDGYWICEKHPPMRLNVPMGKSCRVCEGEKL